MSRVLVTGGCGFLGAALVRRLVARGEQVRVLDNESRGSVRRLADIVDDVEYIRGDIRDPGCVAKATEGVGRVCHLACVNGTEFFYSKPELVLEVGVKGIVNVIDACLQHGVRDLVFVSSSEVYQTPQQIPTDETAPFSIPDPANPRYSYAGCKQISELMVLNYGRRHFDRTVIVRPHNVYGAEMGVEHVVPQFVLRMRALALREEGAIRFPIQGDGSETRAFVHVDDFTDGVLLAIERGEHQGIYHIGTTEEIQIRELAGLVAGYFGRDLEIVPGEAAAGGTPRRCPDIARIAALGYAPRVSIREGLPGVASWYDAHAEELTSEGSKDE